MSFFLLFSVLGGLGYYLWPQTTAAFSVLTLVAGALAVRWPLGTLGTVEDSKEAEGGAEVRWWWRAGMWGVAAIGITGWVFTLWGAQSTEALRGPWDALPLSSVLWLAVPFALALLSRQAVLMALLLGVGTLVTAVVFPLGFGFDPFVHQATVEHLMAYGDISPKQPYYAAFYALVQGMATVFALPVQRVLRFLLPTLFTLTAWWGVRGARPPLATAWVLSLLFFPLNIITQGTPYALGTLFFLITILAGWRGAPVRLQITAALAALLTHPIPGMFALAAFGTARRSLWGRALGVCAAALGVPALFFTQSFLQGGAALTPTLQQLLELFSFAANGTYAPWTDLTYWLGANRWWLAVFFALLGTALAHRPSATMLAGGAAILSAIGTAGVITFTNLPTHEQLDYARRLLELSTLFFLPTLTHLFTTLLDRLPRLHDRWPLALLSGLTLSSMIIAAYPRHDAYARFGGITVSAADYRALAAIEVHAQGSPYAVLANQAMSAAALQTFGFVDRYVGENHDVYFYPIPSGSLFGQLATTMLQEGITNSGIARMFTLTSSDILYVVVHDYWNLKTKLAAQLAPLSSEIFAPAPGITVYVLRWPLPTLPASE